MSPEAPWRLDGRECSHGDGGSAGWLPRRLRSAPAWVAAAIAEQGLHCVANEALSPAMAGAAEELIGRCPGLTRVIRGVALEVHLIAAEPGYDVSHSEPRWPHRVFVSVPDRTDLVGSLRFAEGIIHEAMHLELTLAEAIQPLVRDEEVLLGSPWRREARPAQGVLHGMYVFTCLHVYFGRIVSGLMEGRAHVEARLSDIRAEVDEIDLASLASALTPAGKRVLECCRAAVILRG